MKSIQPLFTHQVFNQSKPLKNFNFFQSDSSLLRAFKAYNIDSSQINHLNEFGVKCGSIKLFEAAERAERNIPKLKQFDSYGRRIDIIDYHPDYYKLMQHGIEGGASSYGYNNESLYGSHISRAGLMYMENQLEPGHCCPIVMTSAAIAVLRKNEYLDANYLKKLLVQLYDPRNIPIDEKQAITAGMSMTEKQGGSDVRANTSIATPVDPNKTGPGNAYYLRGHKWFTSAPMSDIFLTLAKVNESSPPSCFVVPRWTPDGKRNEGFRVMRLKDKLADRANASSEVEYDNAYGILISEPGKGVKTIIDMVNSTRMDCTLGSAASCKRALQHALNHTYGRSTFGVKLIEHPLMQNLLTDLCIESEAHTLTALKLAALFDKMSKGIATQQENNFFRVAVSVAKYYITKRQPNFIYECMEVFGGNGFVEDFPMAKMFRHSPLNSIWEGSGNIIALDVLRASSSFPDFLLELRKMTGKSKEYDNLLSSIEKNIIELEKDGIMSNQSQRKARGLVDMLAVALETYTLLEMGHDKITECYIQSRLVGSSGTSSFSSLGGHSIASYGSYTFSSHDSQQIIDDVAQPIL